MFRLFECCALSFFERFVLSFSLKIERFVSDSAEIWICGLYIEVSKNVGKTIVLIDQLDALSQYLSSNRDYVNTYIQLIESLKNRHNIRVIVSIREYDLNYDFSFHAYKNNIKIQVSELHDKDVESVLSKLKLAKGDLTGTLFSLLRNPNNLDVFCRIYNNKTKAHEIKTLQDLYVELWKQLIQNPKIDKNKLKEFLYPQIRN